VYLRRGGSFGLGFPDNVEQLLQHGGVLRVLIVHAGARLRPLQARTQDGG
jgi:hypothetical protein